MFKRILVPLDGSPAAEKILPFAVQLAQDQDANLELLTVVFVHTFPGVDPTEAQVKVVNSAETYLQSLVKDLGAKRIQVQTHVRYGMDAEEILDAATRMEIDLILMGSHGHSGLGRWNLGGVTKRVVSHCLKPVLTVRISS